MRMFLLLLSHVHNRYNGGVYIHRQSIPRYESTVKCYIDLFGERPGKFALVLFSRHMNSCVQCDVLIILL